MYIWTDASRIATPWGVAFVCALLVTWFWSRRNAARKELDTSHIDLLVPLAAIAIGLRIRWRDRPTGTLGLYAACAYGVGRFLLEFLRADSDSVVAGLNLVQLQATGFVALILLVRWTAVAGQARSNPPRAA